MNLTPTQRTSIKFKDRLFKKRFILFKKSNHPNRVYIMDTELGYPVIWFRLHLTAIRIRNRMEEMARDEKNAYFAYRGHLLKLN